MTWENPRWQRLLAWGLWRYSPSLGRAPTFREAWTGIVVGNTPGDAAREGFEQGWRESGGPELPS